MQKVLYSFNLKNLETLVLDLNFLWVTSLGAGLEFFGHRQALGPKIKK